MANRAAAKTSKQRIVRCKNATKVMNLRLAGLSFEKIGKKLGFSAPRAYKICCDELERLNNIRNETVSQVQRLELERLDALWAAYYAKALKGETHAAKMCLDIMNRRAKLLGLDLADKQQQAQTGPVTLCFTEVLVTRENKRIETNGENDAPAGEPLGYTIEAGAVAPEPDRLPEE